MDKTKFTKLGLTTLIGYILFIQSAAADMSSDLTNFTNITTSFTTMMVSILSLFLQPPLVYFVVLVLFVAVIGIAKRLMHAGGR